MLRCVLLPAEANCNPATYVLLRLMHSTLQARPVVARHMQIALEGS
jgi:hypothetical protein